jgi:hypothetical protein
MTSLGELQISFPLFFVSEKVDQDEVFYYKDTLNFFLG